MKRLFPLGVACLFLFPAATRADQISWSYTWSSLPTSVPSDGSGTSFIFIATPSGPAVGSADIVAAVLITFSTAPANAPATFTNSPYLLSVGLTDSASGNAGVLTFSGRFNGTLSSSSANITNVFDNPTTQSLQLGTNTYTVTLGPYTAPSTSTPGFIQAQVAVNSALIPEPSTLSLAGLGLLGLAGRAWQVWRRRHGSAAPRRSHV